MNPCLGDEEEILSQWNCRTLWYSLAHKSENVYNLSDILIQDHDVRAYFTGPHGRGNILHFAGSGHRRILKLWEAACYPKEDEKGPPRWKQFHPGLIENGGVWTLPVDCRPIESLKFKWHLIEKASQIYILVIFISFSLNVTLFNWHKVNNVTQILISNVNLAEEPKRSSLFKPF